MKFTTVEYEFDGQVATIAMNRPDALNALSVELTKDLRAAVARAIDDNARAAILTGRGRAFCSGGDLREMRSFAEREGRIEAFLEEPLAELHSLIAAIREAPMPFVAAVDGVSAGAGTNLALACDLIVAAEDATFNEAFVRIGLSPDCGGTFFLPRAIGEKRAAEMFMLGGTITAAEAAACGMINRVVESGKALSTATDIAAKLASGPTGSFARIKEMLNASSSNDLLAQLALEHECQLRSGRSSDFREGVDAFFEKRPPKFTGR